MRECPFCGERAEADDRFCGKCGAELLDRRAADTRRETVPVISVAEVHRRLGSVYYRQGNRQGALTSWAKSLDLEPDDEETLALVAQVKSEIQRD
jgi:predicted amidophosphoribosyltransferase